MSSLIFNIQASGVPKTFRPFNITESSLLRGWQAPYISDGSRDFFTSGDLEAKDTQGEYRFGDYFTRRWSLLAETGPSVDQNFLRAMETGEFYRMISLNDVRTLSIALNSLQDLPEKFPDVFDQSAPDNAALSRQEIYQRYWLMQFEELTLKSLALAYIYGDDEAPNTAARHLLGHMSSGNTPSNIEHACQSISQAFEDIAHTMAVWRYDGSEVMDKLAALMAENIELYKQTLTAIKEHPELGTEQKIELLKAYKQLGHIYTQTMRNALSNEQQYLRDHPTIAAHREKQQQQSGLTLVHDIDEAPVPPGQPHFFVPSTEAGPYGPQRGKEKMGKEPRQASFIPAAPTPD